jgi:hypothetical protein
MIFVLAGFVGGLKLGARSSVGSFGYILGPEP